MKRLLIIVTALSPTVGCRWAERQFGGVPLEGRNVIYQRYDSDGDLVEESRPHYDRSGKYTSPFAE